MGENAQTDGDLVRRARAGDSRAYAELVERHQATAFRAAVLITRSAPDAEEATQDAFVKAWRALDRFREDAPFRPWLLRIVKNEALNRVRSRRRREGLALRAAAQPQSAAADAESEALSQSERAALSAAVDRLPERHRLVVSCLYFLGLSEEETAAMLGIPRGTVKSRAARARTLLAKAMEGTR